MNDDETREIPLEEIIKVLSKKEIEPECKNYKKAEGTQGLYECMSPMSNCEHIIYWYGYYCMRYSWKLKK